MQGPCAPRWGRFSTARASASRIALLGLLVAVIGSACGGGEDRAIRLYTSVTQGTVDSVVAGFRAGNPGTAVEVFRAPTGEINARLAVEAREGGVQADVLWLTDPLSMQQYEADGLLRVWSPRGSSEIPDFYKADSFWGTRILTMVIIAGAAVEPPASWRDLVDERYAGRVAFPDPGVAGSSFAVLGYFATTPGYGMDFYRALAHNGAVQVNAPGEVVTGVAEGRFDVGITLEFSARNAVDDGSPIVVVWPKEGAISLYSPIAVVEGGAGGEDFVEYVLTRDAQERIAAAGWQPISTEVGWEEPGAQVSVDWPGLFGRQQDLLDEYRSIFGG